MNHLQNFKTLKNRYFGMRHGESKANVKGLIISHPENGTHADYALTENGKQQAAESAKNSELGSETIIYSSDFSRAVETAEAAQRVLGAKKINLTEALRERHFGQLENLSHKNYSKIHAADKNSVDHEEHGVESINSLVDRTTKLVFELEQKYKNKNILLVSHGDTLEILQTVLENQNLRNHKALNIFKNAEIKQLNFKR